MNALSYAPAIEYQVKSCREWNTSEIGQSAKARQGWLQEHDQGRWLVAAGPSLPTLGGKATQKQRLSVILRKH